jgi:Xaa-Pro aminopeptidase
MRNEAIPGCIHASGSSSDGPGLRVMAAWLFAPAGRVRFLRPCGLSYPLPSPLRQRHGAGRMRHAPIPSSLFSENRDRLRALLPEKSLVIVNAADIPPTNADGTTIPVPASDLFYLSGVAQEESILVICPDAHEEKHREMLFLRETSEHIAIWEGRKLTKEEARERTGIQRIHWLDEFPVLMRRLMVESDHVFLNSNEHARAEVVVETRECRFVRQTMRDWPLHSYQRLARLMHELRAVKSKPEIDLLKQACAITRDGFLRVCRFVKPGVNETEVEAEFAHEFIRRGARFAYNPIIASGANANALHYNDNDQPCKKGDLLLLDVGAAYANYNADMTRTIPVSGKFTPRQRDVYDSVLRVLRGCTEGLKPGKLPKDWQKEAEELMERELVRLKLLTPKEIKAANKKDPEKPALKKYFMHGVGHPLGLDVHDIATIGQPFAPGWVMTVEPGIYLPKEGFGIRLEDDILITATGTVNLMGDIPIEAREVEAAMRR